MSQVCDEHFDQSNSSSPPPINMLDLVNERLLKSTDQQRVSNLKTYFQGYREYLETPPSPAPSDPDQLFSYLEQNSAPDRAASLSLSRPKGPQSPREAESQVSLGKTNNPKLRSRNGSEGRKERHECTRSRTVEAGRVRKADSKSTHNMETRSRSCAWDLEGLGRGGGWNEKTEMGLVNEGCGDHTPHNGSIDLTHGCQAATSTVLKADQPHLSDIESGLNGALLRSALNSVRPGKRTSLRRKTPHQINAVQAQGVRKVHQRKRRPSRKTVASPHRAAQPK